MESKVSTRNSYLPGRVNAGKPWTYEKGKQASLRAVDLAYPSKNCTKGCLEEQIDHHYGKNSKPSRRLKQSKGEQGIGEDRHAYEAYVDLVFGGP